MSKVGLLANYTNFEYLQKKKDEGELSKNRVITTHIIYLASKKEQL